MATRKITTTTIPKASNPAVAKLDPKTIAFLDKYEADYQKQLAAKNQTTSTDKPVVTVTENSLTRTDNNKRTYNTDTRPYKIIEEEKPKQIIVYAQNDASIQDRINQLAEAKKAQAIADLGKARDTQLSNLLGEESAIKPKYYDARNATASTNMANRRTLAEELAARGETNSGVADQANINANMSLQGNLGTLNRQETADFSDIARRRTGVQNAYESDVASAKANLEALAMQKLIDQYNADRAFKLQEAGVTGTYGGNQTFDAINANRNFALNQAGITGTYNGQQTMDAQNQAFNQNMATQQYNQALKQQKLDNLYRQQTFDYQKSRDAVSDNQWQQSMNLNLRQQTFSEAQQRIENAYQARQISLDEKNQALQWAKYNADQDPNSLDNRLKKQQIEANTQSKLASQVNTIIDNYNNLYTTKAYNQSTGTTTVTPNKTSILNALHASVISGTMSEDTARQVAGYYGISL